MKMLETSKINLLDNKVEVIANFINDIKIWNGTVKGVIDTRSDISLITEDLYPNLLSQGLEMLELKLQSVVLLTAFRGRSQRIKKLVDIPFYIGDDCFEHVFLISGQLIELLLTGADFLQEYGFVVNF
jgi:hypothetical protein